MNTRTRKAKQLLRDRKLTNGVVGRYLRYGCACGRHRMPEMMPSEFRKKVRLIMGLRSK